MKSKINTTLEFLFVFDLFLQAYKYKVNTYIKLTHKQQNFNCSVLTNKCLNVLCNVTTINNCLYRNWKSVHTETNFKVFIFF